MDPSLKKKKKKSIFAGQARAGLLIRQHKFLQVWLLSVAFCRSWEQIWGWVHLLGGLLVWFQLINGLCGQSVTVQTHYSSIYHSSLDGKLFILVFSLQNTLPRLELWDSYWSVPRKTQFRTVYHSKDTMASNRFKVRINWIFFSRIKSLSSAFKLN